MDPQRVIIFGGSFNPPTVAHEAIIKTCLEMPQFNAVWVMPSGNRADKRIGVSGDHRLHMLELVKHGSFADDPRLAITDFELKLPHPTRLHQTVLALRTTYPTTDFWFAVGGDAYRSRREWFAADDFIDSLSFVVFTNHALASSPRIIQVPLAPDFDHISSSRVRTAVRQHQNIREFVSPAVAAYLRAYTLYT